MASQVTLAPLCQVSQGALVLKAAEQRLKDSDGESTVTPVPSGESGDGDAPSPGKTSGQGEAPAEVQGWP